MLKNSGFITFFGSKIFFRNFFLCIFQGILFQNLKESLIHVPLTVEAYSPNELWYPPAAAAVAAAPPPLIEASAWPKKQQIGKHICNFHEK